MSKASYFIGQRDGVLLVGCSVLGSYLPRRLISTAGKLICVEIIIAQFFQALYVPRTYNNILPSEDAASLNMSGRLKQQ